MSGTTKAEIDWARSEAARLIGECDREQKKTDTEPGEAAAGLEFLRRAAGEDSTFYQAARNPTTRFQWHPRRIWRPTAEQLLDWARVAEAGVLARPAALVFRLDAAIDLMQQVQTLLGDSKVHPAAPVMLAGAALEEALRGMVEADPAVAVVGRPSIASYSAALKKAGIITKGQDKDAISLADTRNDAAHGRFDLISPERAALFADRVNLFLSQVTPA